MSPCNAGEVQARVERSTCPGTRRHRCRPDPRDRGSNPLPILRPRWSPSGAERVRSGGAAAEGQDDQGESHRTVDSFARDQTDPDRPRRRRVESTATATSRTTAVAISVPAVLILRRASPLVSVAMTRPPRRGWIACRGRRRGLHRRSRQRRPRRATGSAVEPDRDETQAGCIHDRGEPSGETAEDEGDRPDEVDVDTGLDGELPDGPDGVDVAPEWCGPAGWIGRRG